MYWFVLNFSLIASRVSKVCVTNGVWVHNYHVTLPSRSTSQRRTTPATNATCDEHCLQIKALQSASRNLTDSMRQSVTKLIDHIYTLTGRVRIPVGNTRPRRTNWLGYALSYVSGLPTDDDLIDFEELIRRVKTSSDSSAAGLELTRQEMATYAKLSNERMDNLHTILNSEVTAINKIQDYVRSLSGTMNVEMAAMIYLMDELKQYTKIHDSMAEIHAGIHDLITDFCRQNWWTWIHCERC